MSIFLRTYWSVRLIAGLRSQSRAV